MWKICADTGGTFTDLIAFAPSGEVITEKVLSNSSLRGRIVCREGPNSLRIETNWMLPEDFLRGFEFRLFDRERSRATVLKYDPENSQIILSECLWETNLEDVLFEVVSPEEAPILGARLVTGVGQGRALPPMNLCLGTTKGTNALLEERGSRLVLIVTKGFRDLLKIGDQRRPDLFALDIRKPTPLPESVIEVEERISATGEVLIPIEPQSIAAELDDALGNGCSVAVVALMNSYRNPSHEEFLSAYLQKCGFSHVISSSIAAPFIKYLDRTETAVVDGYLSEVMSGYLSEVKRVISTGRLSVMASSGGLIPQERYTPKDSLLSGPAAGVVGAVNIGASAGFTKLLTFDMGGTSTDVSRYDDDFEYTASHTVGRARVLLPALKIETVAAGGGSICGWRSGRLFVGPQSAGAHPGPACYGWGGPLTITDVNFLLGRLDDERFEIPVVPEEARSRLRGLLEKLEKSAGEVIDREQLLCGFLDVANERMADAIIRISVREGYDPAEHVMVAFGGAGGMHACAVAERLEISKIIVPAESGLLSARGLHAARTEVIQEQQVLATLDDCSHQLEVIFGELENEALTNLKSEGEQGSGLYIRESSLQMRFFGQESSLMVPYRLGVNLAEEFAKIYRSVFGYVSRDRVLEIVSARVIASTRAGRLDRETFPRNGDFKEVKWRMIRSYVEDEWKEVPAFDRGHLAPGFQICGPAILTDSYSTTVVDSGWCAIVGSASSVLLKREVRTEDRRSASELEFVNLELFTNRFRSIVDEMGLQLQRTALSTNVKDRMDFSCALLDADGYLLVNAPHIPVHLGALGLCVRAIASSMELEPGDVVITNHPAFGGSHLPDLTVVTPVFNKEGDLVAYLANRAHHAEIGGIRPGSIPAHAKVLAEEGVVIAPRKLFANGQSRFDELAKLLAGGDYPTRALDDNLADIRAQVAANIRGVERLHALRNGFGEERIRHYLQALKDHARGVLEKRLASLRKGNFKARERLDDGHLIVAEIEVSDAGLIFDFSGSAPPHPGNFNATSAIVRSVILYVLRLLADEDIPLNEGLMDIVEVRLPNCFLNPEFPSDPKQAPAVVGGNVETSQRLVNAVLRALGLVAGSQGTMNNLTFGNERFSYYETICGGSGAGPGFEGADGVHTHMSNTAITDAEILEHRYPVRLWKFALREHSGGVGRFRGGDGAIREIEFLEPVSLSLLTQYRDRGPCGLAGGRDGQPGRQRLLRFGGDTEKLRASDERRVHSGDRIVVETPSGGGYGRPNPHATVNIGLSD